jgi:hypothetical protein
VPEENLLFAHGHDVISLHRRMVEMEEKHSFHYTLSNIHHILRCDGAKALSHLIPRLWGKTERDSLSDAFFWLGGFGCP